MRIWIWVRRGLVAAVLMLAAAVVNGFVLPLKVHFTWTPEAADAVPLAEFDRPFVGLALSGGGSRAAVFAAAGIEALAQRGLLEAVTHVSSVSGGGFAASYLAVNPVPDCADDPCREAYFAGMRAMAAHNFLWDVEVGQVSRPTRAFSPSRRLTSLREAFDAAPFLNGATFGQIDPSRAFYFNAVSYDTGQRFVFGTGALTHPAAVQAHVLPQAVRGASFSDPGTRRVTPEDLPVSLAVATSAAFPPYLGPATIQVNTEEGARFWHLGDGGVFENTGIETLREVVMAQPAPPPALIYAFNAGQRIDSDLSQNTADISIWSRDISRLVDVVVAYAGDQREALFGELQASAGLEIEVVSFNYLDIEGIVEGTGNPDWTEWATWDGVCSAGDRGDSATPAAHLATVPTALRITPCNAALMRRAAAFLVDHHLPRSAP